MLSHFHLYGELRSSGVMGRRNGTSGLRDDVDDTCSSFLVVRAGASLAGRYNTIVNS